MLRPKQLFSVVHVIAVSIGCATMTTGEDRMENKTHSKFKNDSILLIRESAEAIAAEIRIWRDYTQAGLNLRAR